MTVSIAHLDLLAPIQNKQLWLINWFIGKRDSYLVPYPNIAQTLRAVAQGQAELAVVPVENSIEGSVAITLDMLWQLGLQIQMALVTRSAMHCCPVLKH